jgi:hypothetical protein
LYHGDLEILEWAAPKKDNTTLPSWVPDRSQLNSEWIGMYSWISPHEWADPDAEFTNGGDVLSVKGVSLHTILDPQTVAGDDGHDIYHVLRDCYAKVLNGVVIEAGDEIWLLFGSPNVWVLRKVRTAFKLVCKAKLETASGAGYEPDMARCMPTRIEISNQ